MGCWRGDLTLIGFVFVVLHLVELHEALAAGQKGGRFVPQAVSASSCWSGRGGWLDKVEPSTQLASTLPEYGPKPAPAHVGLIASVGGYLSSEPVVRYENLYLGSGASASAATLELGRYFTLLW